MAWVKVIQGAGANLPWRSYDGSQWRLARKPAINYYHLLTNYSGVKFWIHSFMFHLPSFNQSTTTAGALYLPMSHKHSPAFGKNWGKMAAVLVWRMLKVEWMQGFYKAGGIQPTVITARTSLIKLPGPFLDSSEMSPDNRPWLSLNRWKSSKLKTINKLHSARYLYWNSDLPECLRQ